MANAPITAPFLTNSGGTSSPALTRPGQTDASTGVTWTVGQTWVSLVANVLTRYVADDIIIYGLCPDPAHTTTSEPYTAPYGQIHNVISPVGQQFVMNISDGSGTVGSGTTTQAAVSIGTLYSGVYLGSPYTANTILAVDASDSGAATKNIFKVEALWPQDATTDFNGRVIVSVLPSAIQ